MTYSYRERLHSKLIEAYRRMTENGVKYTFQVCDNPCEYGNWYIHVVDNKGFEGYLYPNLTIHTRPAFNAGNHGYYLTYGEAVSVIDRFPHQKDSLPMSPSTSTKTDSNLRNIIQTTLDDFVKSRAMFTAFDVTTKIRNDQQQNGIHVFHSVVKEYVHDNYENGLTLGTSGYDRTLIPIGNPPPWLYYIPGVHDPSSYTSSATNTPGGMATTSYKTQKQTRTKVQPATPNLKVKRSAVATFGGFTGGNG